MRVVAEEAHGLSVMLPFPGNSNADGCDLLAGTTGATYTIPLSATASLPPCGLNVSAVGALSGACAVNGAVVGSKVVGSDVSFRGALRRGAGACFLGRARVRHQKPCCWNRPVSSVPLRRSVRSLPSSRRLASRDRFGEPVT